MQLSERAQDVGAAVAVAAAMTLTISVAEETGARDPNVLAYALGIVIGALLLARRRWPMGVLVGSIGVLMIYLSFNFPAFAPAVAFAAAAYSAAVAGHIVPAGVILGGFVIFAASYQTLGEGASALSVLGTGTIVDAALLAAVLLLGEAVRSRRAWADEVRRRLERAAEDHEREAERRVQVERLRIARDMHDVMAHTIAAINVHAGVAADVIDAAPDQARESLHAIREQSREAMAELKATVGILRGSAADVPAPGLATLDGLVEMATGAGVRVDVSVAGTARPLPSAVDAAAYRIVQESLTNVVRHADASVASVAVRYDPESVVLRIEDDGRGPVNGSDGGHGLAGMRERAAAVGGTLEAGPVTRGGFRVLARLPTAGA